MPTFSVDSRFGKTFKDWLSSALGGGKSERESALSCKRAMKYLMYCSGCTQPCDELDTTYVDCCLGSAMMMVDFLKEIQSVWNVGYAGAFKLFEVNFRHDGLSKIAGSDRSSSTKFCHHQSLFASGSTLPIAQKVNRVES